MNVTEPGDTGISDEDINQKLQNYIQEHRMLPPWNRKLHCELFNLVKKSNWQEMERCLTLAIAANASEPGAYARAIFASSQAQAVRLSPAETERRRIIASLDLP